MDEGGYQHGFAHPVRRAAGLARLLAGRSPLDKTQLKSVFRLLRANTGSYTGVMNDLQTEEQRRSAIAWAIALTADMALAPDQYERELLERYAQGSLTLTEVITRLDTRVHHLLYHSQATRPLNSADLTDLLEKSLAWNDAHAITGMLCYSNGHFVQVLEGAATDVQALFAKIRQDARHHQVVALSERSSGKRWFADWRMAFVDADLHEVYWLLGYLEARGHNLVKPQFPLAPSHLMTLVQQFSTL